MYIYSCEKKKTRGDTGSCGWSYAKPRIIQAWKHSTSQHFPLFFMQVIHLFPVNFFFFFERSWVQRWYLCPVEPTKVTRSVVIDLMLLMAILIVSKFRFLIFYLPNRKKAPLLFKTRDSSFTCTVVRGFLGVKHTRVQAACAHSVFVANARVSPVLVNPLSTVTFCPNLGVSRRNKFGFRPRPEVTLPATKG